MSFKAKWSVSGTTIENSVDALTKSVAQITDGNALKKYEAHLNKSLRENIQNNMRRAGIGDKNFDEAFLLRIANGSIIFTNTSPLITQRYEYGYYDNNKNDDEYYDEAYMVETSPRYFIRPAIQETLQEVGNLINQELKNQYLQYRRQTNGDDIL